MESREQLMKIAHNCSRYDREADAAFASSVNIMGKEEISCESCGHFTREHTCELDLIDPILSNMAMELEDKYED